MITELKFHGFLNIIGVEDHIECLVGSLCIVMEKPG